MEQVTTVGIDLAKRVFALHGVDGLPILVPDSLRVSGFYSPLLQMQFFAAMANS